MSYRLLILRRAQKELAALPRQIYLRIQKELRELANQPRPSGCRKLTGRDGWRIRVGDYRIIYEIDDANTSLTILHVGHRKDVYS
jgi:mRNA interferase RelE/StbE